MDLKKFKFLIVGIALLVVCVGMLFYANNELSKCDSIGGKVVQFLDSDKREGCAGMETLKIVCYGGIALGVAGIVLHFIKEK